MSFLLLEEDKSLIAYSVFESLADCFVTILLELNGTYKAENFIIAGTLLENKALFSRLVTKLDKQRLNFKHIYVI
jgi:hydrogenase maturation factor HypF (carbamoyltransferase family)